MKGIGRCIRKYRERAGITQEQLAEKVNISTNHLGAIEREVKTPTMDTFVKILNAIGAEPNEALKEVVPVVWKEDISILEEKLSELTPTQRGERDSYIESDHKRDYSIKTVCEIVVGSFFCIAICNKMRKYMCFMMKESVGFGIVIL